MQLSLGQWFLAQLSWEEYIHRDIKPENFLIGLGEQHNDARPQRANDLVDLPSGPVVPVCSFLVWGKGSPVNSTNQKGSEWTGQG